MTCHPHFVFEKFEPSKFYKKMKEMSLNVDDANKLNGYVGAQYYYICTYNLVILIMIGKKNLIL